MDLGEGKHMHFARWLVLALALPAAAFAGDGAVRETPSLQQAELNTAVGLLSRYPAGLMPVDPYVMGAIGLLGTEGTREEVSLLRSLVENERVEVRDAAAQAIASIRGRQRQTQREAFAHQLPDWPEIEAVAQEMNADGLGRESAMCVAYASIVLGGIDAEVAAIRKNQGDAARLLASGHARKALAAAASDDTDQARMLQARAREDLGDVHGAVRQYAMLAASGDTDARSALDGFGVDAERLLLGLFLTPDRSGETHREAEILEVLVRHGDTLTVSVLGERTRAASASDRATAADALARMLDPDVRPARLPLAVERDAQRALAVASREGPDPVREIANEALKSAATER